MDFYGHCWFQASGAKEYSGGEHAKKFRISPATPQLLRKLYPGIEVCFEEPKMAADLIEFIDFNQKDKKKILLENPLLPVFISQLYSIDQALRFFDLSSVGERYDFVVLSRYDNFVALLPTDAQIEKDKLTVKMNSGENGFPDLVFIGTRQLLETINVYPEVNRYLHPGKRVTPELLKEEHFLTVSNEESLSFRDFELLVVRDSRLFKYISYFVRVRLSLVRLKLTRRKIK